MTESPCCAPETLWVDYTSIIYVYKEKNKNSQWQKQAKKDFKACNNKTPRRKIKLQIQSLYFLQIYSDFRFLLESILVIGASPRICPFCLSYLILWHIMVHSIPLWFILFHHFLWFVCLGENVSTVFWCKDLADLCSQGEPRTALTCMHDHV